MVIGDERRLSILESLRRTGVINARQLQERFGVSDMTIRRDLIILEAEGLLRRVRGGAITTDQNPARAIGEVPFDNRVLEYIDKKQAIGRAAADLVRDGKFIFLDGSSTAVYMTRHLKPSQNLTVVTDSLAVLQALAGKPGVEPIVIGGILQKDMNTIDGPFAIENLEKLTLDMLFFSCSGFDGEKVYNPGLIGTAAKRVAIRNAQRKVLLANSEKFEQRNFYTICNLAEIDVLVSDDGLPDTAAEMIRRMGVELILVSPAGEAQSSPPAPQKPSKQSEKNR